MSIHGECFDRCDNGNCNTMCSILQDGECNGDWEEVLIWSHDEELIDDEEFLDYIDLYS
jgi:hypothetical protein